MIRNINIFFFYIESHNKGYETIGNFTNTFLCSQLFPQTSPKKVTKTKSIRDPTTDSRPLARQRCFQPLQPTLLNHSSCLLSTTSLHEVSQPYVPSHLKSDTARRYRDGSRLRHHPFLQPAAVWTKTEISRVESPCGKPEAQEAKTNWTVWEMHHGTIGMGKQVNGRRGFRWLDRSKIYLVVSIGVLICRHVSARGQQLARCLQDGECYSNWFSSKF